MGKFLVSDRLHFDGHEYGFGDAVTIEDENVAEELLGLRVIVGDDAKWRIAVEWARPRSASRASRSARSSASSARARSTKPKRLRY